MATTRRSSLAQRLRRIQKAARIKWNKYIWSGLILVLVGLVLIGYGVALNTGAYSGEGIAIGIGAIIVLVGIIRILIGAINPASPEDLLPYEDFERHEEELAQEEQEPLDDQLFEHEDDRTTQDRAP